MPTYSNKSYNLLIKLEQTVIVILILVLLRDKSLFICQQRILVPLYLS